MSRAVLRIYCGLLIFGLFCLSVYLSNYNNAVIAAETAEPITIITGSQLPHKQNNSIIANTTLAANSTLSANTSVVVSNTSHIANTSLAANTSRPNTTHSQNASTGTTNKPIKQSIVVGGINISVELQEYLAALNISVQDFPSLKFASFENDLSGDGLTMQKQKFAKFVTVAVHTKRVVVLPDFKISYSDGDTLPASQLFNIRKMNEPWLPTLLFIPKELLPASITPQMTHSIEDMKSETKYVKLNSLKNQIGAMSGGVYNNILSGFREIWRASEPIEKTVHEMIKTMGENFTCIHLRTEPDFRAWFGGPPAFYTKEEIKDKIRKTNWPQLQPVLFLAGNHQQEDVNFWNDTFTHTYLKEDLLSPNSPYKSSDHPMTLAAELDYEVCKSAKSFIGNNHSSWSEEVYDSIVWKTDCQDCVKMVNPSNRDNHYGPLLPFCSANNQQRHGISCTYYRVTG